MDFLTTLMAILTNVINIPGYNENDNLIGVDGELVPGPFPQIEMIKLVRLQTMIGRISSQSNIPEISEIQNIQDVTGDGFHQVLGRSVRISSRAIRQIRMLNQLIEEIVHKAIPSETTREDVVYRINAEYCLVHIPHQDRSFD